MGFKSLSSYVLAEDGTVGSPGISFYTWQASGFYIEGSGGVSLSIRGTKAFGVDTNGQITLGSSGSSQRILVNAPTASPAAVSLTLTNGPTGTSGNPAWIQVQVNGSNYVIPAWAGA